MPIRKMTDWKRKQHAVEERIRKLEQIQEETRQWRRSVSEKRKDLLWKRKDYQRFQEKSHQKITTVVKDTAWKLDQAKQERREVQQKIKEIKRQQTMLLPFVIVMALVLMMGIGAIFFDFSNGITGLAIKDISLGIGDEIIVNDTTIDLPEEIIAIEPPTVSDELALPSAIDNNIPEENLVEEEEEQEPTPFTVQLPAHQQGMGLFNEPIDTVTTPTKPLFVQKIKTTEEVIQETGIRVDREKVRSIIQPTYSSVEIDFKEGLYQKGLIIHSPLVNGQIVTKAIPLIDKDQYTYSATFEETTMDVAFEQSGIGIAIGNFSKFSQSNIDSWKIGYKYPLPAEVFTARIRVSSSSPIEIKYNSPFSPTDQATETIHSGKFILDFSVEQQNGYIVNTFQAAPQVVYVYLTKNFTAEGKAVNEEIILDPTLTISGTRTELCGTVRDYDLVEVISGGVLQVCRYNTSDSPTGTAGMLNLSLGYYGNFTVLETGVVEGYRHGANGGQGCGGSACKSFAGNNGNNGTNGTNIPVPSLTVKGAPYQPNGGGGAIATKVAAANSAAGGGGGFGGRGGDGGNSSLANKTMGGAAYGCAYCEALKMGSGGSGHAGDTGTIGLGGNGGAGIKVIAGAGGSIYIRGLFNMTGQNGTIGDATDDGAGGSGSGGHIILKAGTIDINNSRLYAFGASGGNAGVSTADSCPGGGGAGGRVLLVYQTLINSTNATTLYYGGGPGTDGDAECNDPTDKGNATGGETGTSSFNLTAFDKVPGIRIITPADGITNSTNSTPEFIFNVSDEMWNQNFLNCTLWIQTGQTAAAYGTNNTVFNATATQGRKTVIMTNASLSNNNYGWWINCTDRSLVSNGYNEFNAQGGSNTTVLRNLTINIVVPGDETPPQVTIGFPRIHGLYSARDLPLNFNVTLNENGSVLYSINYSRNVSMTSSDEGTAFGRFFNRTNNTMYDGNFTFIVYANDTAGNRNYTMNVTFEYDGTAPLITYADPTPADGSSQSASYVYLNVTTNDTHDHYSFVELDEDLMLYMRMDQVNSSGDPQDTSGNARHGDVVGGTSINRSYIFGNASYYDGNGDNININGTTNSLAHFINGSRPFTISAWVRLSNTTNRPGATDEFPGLMRLETNQSTVFVVTFGRLTGYEGLNFGSQTGFIGRRTSENLTASFYSNQWFHIAIAYDGGDIAAGGSYTLYINGTAHPHVNNDGFGAPSRGSRIGIGDSDTISSFNGSIDEVIILKRNISATEAAALYNAKAAQYRQNFTNLSQTAHTFRTQSVDILGNNASSDRTITVAAAGNSAPVITFVSNVSAQTITEGGALRVNFSFTATDTNGAGDLDNATAQLRVNLTGETDRTNTTCHALSIIGANTINYSCSVNIWYFDASGFWTINASIRDSADAYAENLSMAFFLQETTAMRMSPGSITFPHVELGSTNLTSNSDPLVLNNTGNRDISVGGITFEGNDLQGVTTTTEFIRAANFSIWPRNGTSSCTGTSCFECNGTLFVNNTFTPLAVANLSVGNNSVNSQNQNSGQEELFLCLRAVAPEISRQSYSTSAGPLTDVWTVAIS